VKTQRSADIMVGWFVTLLGLFVILSSTMIKGGAAHRLPPQTFPMVVGFLLLICGIGLTCKAWRLRGADLAIKWPDREGFWTIVVSIASLGCFISLMDPLGLPLASFGYIAFTTWYLKRTKWLTAIIIGLITGVASYYLFIRLLALSFPEGALFGG
jgi:xanthine/uracil permease